MNLCTRMRLYTGQILNRKFFKYLVFPYMKTVPINEVIRYNEIIEFSKCTAHHLKFLSCLYLLKYAVSLLILKGFSYNVALKQASVQLYE